VLVCFSPSVLRQIVCFPTLRSDPFLGETLSSIFAQTLHTKANYRFPLVLSVLLTPFVLFPFVSPAFYFFACQRRAMPKLSFLFTVVPKKATDDPPHRKFPPPAGFLTTPGFFPFFSMVQIFEFSMGVEGATSIPVLSPPNQFVDQGFSDFSPTSHWFAVRPLFVYAVYTPNPAPSSNPGTYSPCSFLFFFPDRILSSVEKNLCPLSRLLNRPALPRDSPFLTAFPPPLCIDTFTCASGCSSLLNQLEGSFTRLCPIGFIFSKFQTGSDVP